MNIHILKRIAFFAFCIIAMPKAIVAAEAHKKAHKRKASDGHEGEQAAKQARIMTEQELAAAKTLEEMRMSKQRQEKAGLLYAQKRLPNRVFAYICQPSKQIPESIAAQLDALFANDKIQAAFLVLEEHPTNRETLAGLEERGFVFLDRYDVFKHKSIPGYVFKIANQHELKDVAFASNIGRLWYGDYIRTQCAEWSIIVPEKWIHFMTKPCRCAILHAIIVAQEHDLKGKKLLVELSPESNEYVEQKLNSLGYPDEAECNVYGTQDSQSYILVDTETLDQVDFDTCFPSDDAHRERLQAMGIWAPAQEYKEKA